VVKADIKKVQAAASLAKKHVQVRFYITDTQRQIIVQFYTL